MRRRSHSSTVRADSLPSEGGGGETWTVIYFWRERLSTVLGFNNAPNRRRRTQFVEKNRGQRCRLQFILKRRFLKRRFLKRFKKITNLRFKKKLGDRESMCVRISCRGDRQVKWTATIACLASYRTASTLIVARPNRLAAIQYLTHCLQGDRLGSGGNCTDRQTVQWVGEDGRAQSRTGPDRALVYNHFCKHHQQLQQLQQLRVLRDSDGAILCRRE